MARFHDIDSDIWEDLLDHSPKQKLLYVYLCTNSFSRPSGLYKITVKTIKHHTGATEGDIKGLCGGLIEYDFETQEVFVRGKFKRILSGFKNNEKMRLAVKHDFDSFSSLFIKHLFVKKYEGALEGLVSPPLPLPLPLPLPISLKEEKNSEKKKSKVPESLSEVTTYFSEIGSSSEAPAFFDHFSANGWKVGGKTPMEDWKAAARGWVRRSKSFIQSSTSKPTSDLDAILEKKRKENENAKLYA